MSGASDGGLPAVALPAIGAATMRSIDRLAVDEFGILVPQMMEVAAARLADVASHELDGLAGARLVILAGPGNNGATGIVAARHLVTRGASVHVILARPVNQLAPISRDRLATLIAMSVRCCVAVWDMSGEELDQILRDSDLIVDALLGLGASGPAQDGVADLIRRTGAAGRRVLSLDVPSGTDPDTGEPHDVAIHASATMAVGLPKAGLLTDAGLARAGRIYVADNGLPAELYRLAGLSVDRPFRDGPLIRLDCPG